MGGDENSQEGNLKSTYNQRNTPNKQPEQRDKDFRKTAATFWQDQVPPPKWSAQTGIKETGLVRCVPVIFPHKRTPPRTRPTPPHRTEWRFINGNQFMGNLPPTRPIGRGRQNGHRS